ncbi:MAG: hypothetical protein H6Q10_2183 [Acidobacteria bacterium]|nr:hypothetical protein [Acidobacteriota bacterium]
MSTLTSSAGVVSTCSTRPPDTGTRYSSGCEAAGKPRLAAVSRRAAPKRIARSPGSKAYGNSSAEWKVRRLASPPSAGIAKMSKLPWRLLANAMLPPSWLHTGMKSCASWMVSGTAVPPAAGAR